MHIKSFVCLQCFSVVVYRVRNEIRVPVFSFQFDQIENINKTFIITYKLVIKESYLNTYLVLKFMNMNLKLWFKTHLKFLLI